MLHSTVNGDHYKDYNGPNAKMNGLGRAHPQWMILYHSSYIYGSGNIMGGDRNVVRARIPRRLL